MRVAAALFGAAVLAACGGSPAPPATTTGATIARGGQVIASVRTEPQSFSWYTQHDGTTDLVTFLTQARLVRVNRATGELEPWLAESWTRSNDGLKYTIKLRPNITFADGHPFTSDDVVFSFAAAYAPNGAGPVMGGDMMVGGKPLVVTAPDPATVVITFPLPFAPGLRLLDNLPMLPKHKLEAALKSGTFANAWGLSTPVSEITGLGPYVLTDYLPGQRMIFSRNDRYFRKDTNGAPLPHLDRVIVEIVPDQNGQLLRMETAQTDMMSSEARPEDYASLKRAADAGRLQLLDLGGALDPDSFWINLKPGAFAGDPRAAWLQSEELRKAISLGVNRKAFADTVFLGAGVPVWGPITPANKKWYSPDVPQTPHDPARARQLLASVGLTDRNGDGFLEDAGGRPARFTITTQKGQTAVERGAQVIRDELKAVGLVVDIAALEGNAAVQRYMTGAYEAGYFHVGTTDTDPGNQLEYWLSRGGFHIWDLGQKTPATPWEKDIDGLMAKQTATFDEAERKKIFDEVQKIFAEHLPVINFAAPRIFVAASSRVTGLNPAVQRPQLLWSPDTLAVKP